MDWSYSGQFCFTKSEKKNLISKYHKTMGEEEFLAFHIDDPIPAYFVKSITNISMYISYLWEMGIYPTSTPLCTP